MTILRRQLQIDAIPVPTASELAASTLGNARITPELLTGGDVADPFAMPGTEPSGNIFGRGVNPPTAPIARGFGRFSIGAPTGNPAAVRSAPLRRDPGDAPEPVPGFLTPEWARDDLADPFAPNAAPAAATQPEQPAAAATSPLAAAGFTMPGTTDPQPGAPMQGARSWGNPFVRTPDEEERLRASERRDTRSRIATGIMRGLGYVGQFAGGLAGDNAIGNAFGTSTASFNPEINGYDQALARVNDRQQRDFRAGQYDMAMQDRDIARQTSEANARRQAELDAMNAEYRQAQIEQTRLRTAQVQSEIDAAGTDAAAARNVLAHFAAGLNDNSPAADELRAAVADPSFAGMSAATARDVMARYATLANRRGAGLIDNGGGGGARYTESVDPVTGQLVRVRVPGSGGGATGGPAARPSGGRRAGAAPVQAPTPGPDQPAPSGQPTLAVGEEAIGDIIAAQLRARAPGARPGTPEWNEAYRGLLSVFRGAPTDSARSAVMSQAAQDILTRFEQTQAGGRPAGVTDQMVDRLNREAAPALAARQATDRLAGRMAYWRRTRPEAFRLAVATAGEIGDNVSSAAERAYAGEIRSDLQNYINQYMRATSGAAVTDSESRRIREAMGVGSWGFGTQPLMSFLASERSRANSELATSLRGQDARATAWWLQAQGVR